MKNTMLIITVLFLFFSSYGQDGEESSGKLSINKGTWYTGGLMSFGFTNNNQEFGNLELNSTFTNIAVLPTIGYTISNDLTIGLGFGYGYLSSKSESNDQDIDQGFKSNTYTLMPFIRKYIGLGEKIALYMQGEGQIRKKSNTQTNKLFSYNTKYNEYFIGFRPGITYFLSKKLALETSLGSFGYSNGKSKDNEDHNYESISLNLGSSEFLFGVSYYF